MGCECPLLCPMGWGGTPKAGPTGGPPGPSLTYLLMYSPVRTFPQDLHLKHPKCHCFSRASNACPFLISLPQPAQSGKKAAASSYSTSVLLNASVQASSEAQCSVNIYVRFISPRFLPCTRPFPAVSQAPSSHGMETS